MYLRAYHSRKLLITFRGNAVNSFKKEIALCLFSSNEKLSVRRTVGKPDVDKFSGSRVPTTIPIDIRHWGRGGGKQFKIGTRGIPRECEKECLICIKILARRGQIIEEIFRPRFDFQLKLTGRGRRAMVRG